MARNLNREQLEARRAAAEAVLAAMLAQLAAAQAETRRCLAALAEAQGDLDAAVHELIVHDAQRRLRDDAARQGKRLSADAARAKARRDALRAMALQSDSAVNPAADGPGGARAPGLPAIQFANTPRGASGTAREAPGRQPTAQADIGALKRGPKAAPRIPFRVQKAGGIPSSLPPGHAAQADLLLPSAEVAGRRSVPAVPGGSAGPTAHLAGA